MIGEAVKISSPGSDFLPCDGRVLLQSSYPDLYSVIGHSYRRFFWKKSSLNFPVSTAWRLITSIGGRWFVSNHTNIYYTDDPVGGTWSTASFSGSSSGVGISSLFKAGSNRLVATFANHLGIEYSDDNGVTWTFNSFGSSWRSRNSWVDNGIYLNASGHTSRINIFDNNQQILNSSDNGSTWTKSANILSNFGYDLQPTTFSFDGEICMVTGANNSMVAVTEDNGATWVLRPTTFYSYLFGGIVSGNRVISEYGGYRFQVSTDGGVSWRVVYISPQTYPEITAWTEGTHTPFNNQEYLIFSTTGTDTTTSDTNQHLYTHNGINFSNFFAPGLNLKILYSESDSVDSYILATQFNVSTNEYYILQPSYNYITEFQLPYIPGWFIQVK